MFKNMKPLPKMILIAAFVGGAVFGYSKFGPKPTEPAVAEVDQVETVAERAETLKPPTAQASQVAPAPATPTTQTIPQPVNSPVAQSAGLDALLNLGTKK